MASAVLRLAGAAALGAAVLVPPAAKAEVSVVVDVATGKVLSSKNASARWYPASTTKLMTAYLALKAMETRDATLDTPVIMTQYAATQVPSKMGYEPGSVMRLDMALRMMLVKSANDVAVAIGQTLGGGSLQTFVDRMNSEALALGMKDTHFINPNGLPGEGQYSSAKDLGILGMHLRRDFPAFSEIFGVEAISAGGALIRNTNPLLGRYAGADGMKTGYICASGFNLVASATRDKRTIVAVVLGADSPIVRDRISADLLENGFKTDTAKLGTAIEQLPASDGPPADISQAICSPAGQQARAAEREEEAKRPEHNSGSPLLHEMVRPPSVVDVSLGGAAAGPKVQAGIAQIAGYGIPLPHWRPDDATTDGALPSSAPAAGSPPADGKSARIGGDPAVIGEAEGLRSGGGELTAVPKSADLTAPIRVTVLTGFLGAGKTTLLNRLLADPAVTDTAVIVNEFGEAGIDHLLVETARDGIIELSDGCLCCTIRGDLVDTLADLADRVQTGRLPKLKRVVVETTGLADPTPILAALMGHPALVQAYALDGVVAVIDALAGAQNLAEREEARRQVAVADRVVVSKTDLAGPDALQALSRLIRPINPGAPILDAASGEAGPSALLGCGLYDPATKTADVARWLHDEVAHDAHHRAHGHAPHDHSHAHPPAGEPAHGNAAARHGAIRSFSIQHAAPLPTAQVEAFLDLLRDLQGDRILRMKAIVRTIEHPGRPLVLHGVRNHLHPPARLPAWPADFAPASRLVLIGEGLDERLVRDLFAAFAGEPRLDAPDRAALTDNPLAVPGMSF